MRRKLLGNEHKDVAVTLVELGRVYGDQGDDQRAEPLFRESLTIRRKALGEEDHETAVSLSDLAFGKIYLARVYLARKDPAAAEPLLRDALRIRQRIFPPDDWRIGVPKSVLGAALTALARYDEAEPLLLDAQRVLRDIAGAQGQEARATRARLVALYEGWSRPEKAALNPPGARRQGANQPK